MTKEQALAIIKQPDRIGCHLIKANDEESCKFNQENIEALNTVIESVCKLQKIEQIINGSDDFIKRNADYKIAEIREVLEDE